MFFSFKLKMSYSKHKHVGRRRLTAFIKRYEEKDVQFYYSSTFTAYLPLTSFVDSGALQARGDHYIFKVLKLRWEKNEITVFCETSSSPFGELISKLFQAQVNLHLSISCPWVTNEEKIKTYQFQFRVEIATPHADLSSLCLLIPCTKEDVDNDTPNTIIIGE